LFASLSKKSVTCFALSIGDEEHEWVTGTKTPKLDLEFVGNPSCGFSVVASILNDQKQMLIVLGKPLVKSPVLLVWVPQCR